MCCCSIGLTLAQSRHLVGNHRAWPIWMPLVKSDNSKTYFIALPMYYSHAYLNTQSWFTTLITIHNSILLLFETSASLTGILVLRS